MKSFTKNGVTVKLIQRPDQTFQIIFASWQGVIRSQPKPSFDEIANDFDEVISQLE